MSGRPRVAEAVLPAFQFWSINEHRSTFVAADSICIDGLYRRNDDVRNDFIVQFLVKSTYVETSPSYSAFRLYPLAYEEEEAQFLTNTFNGPNY